tara:strand:+ start:79 stop:909 length:831 start_codon:yes stop_codon:yes gene_type:complete
MAKKKKKLAPRPKPKPKFKPKSTKIDGGMEMASNEFVSDLLASPFMKANPLAKLGLYGLLPDKQTPIPIEAEDRGRSRTRGQYIITSQGRPQRYRLGSPVQKKGMVAIRSEDGTVEYRYPQDLRRVYKPDTIYSNINPVTLADKAREMDRIRGASEGTTSKTQAQIDTLIHELIHRGIFKVDSLKDARGEWRQHRYIDEKQKAYLNPDAAKSSGDKLFTKYYETLLRNDPKAREYIKTHMPELEFYTFGNKKMGQYREKERDSDSMLKKFFSLMSK